MSRPSSSMTLSSGFASGDVASRLVALALFVACGSLSACGGSDGETGSASVDITSISPETTYPGVETTIEFSATPGGGLSADELEWEVDFGDGTSQRGEGTEGSVTYAWEASGQYTIEVTALSGGNPVGSATERLEVNAPLQLSVGDIRPNPANVEVGEQFQVVFDIENASASPVPNPFDVAVYLTDETSVSVEDVGDLTQIGSGTVQREDGPAVEASETRTIDVQAQVPEETEAGEYHLVAWLNPSGELANENPEDGFGVSSQVVRVSSEAGVRPDVVVEDVYTVSDRAYPTLNEVNRGFTLSNEGGGQAFDVSTTTYLSIGDAELDDSDREIHTSESTRDLAPDESVEVGPDRITLDEDVAPEGGEQEVYVIVEATPEGDTSEEITDNNVAASDPPIVVSDERVDGPDIAVDSFSVSPETTYLDGSLQVTMSVSNQGTDDVGSFVCGLYLGSEQRIDTSSDPRFSSISITSLASDSTTEVDRAVTVPALYDPGTYYIYTYCNPDGGLDEPYRNNNRMIHPEPIEITNEADVDLFVDELEVPEQVSEGDEVELTATACVRGSNPSGQTEGALYRTTDSQVDFEDDEPVQTFEVPNIVPGECKDISLTWTASCENFEENYAFGVAVDTEEKLPEDNRDNNTARGTNSLEIDGEYCQCTPDGYGDIDDYNEAPTMSAGEYSASICSPGSCDYFAVLLDHHQSVMVETTYDNDKGPLETTLYHSDGITALDSDASPDRQRVAHFNAETSDDTYYYFSVCGADSSARNLYNFDLDVLSPKSGVDLIPRRPELPTQDTFSIGEEVEVDLNIHNIGDTDSGAFEVDLSISPDSTPNNGNDVPLTPASVSVDPVTGAGSTTVSADVELPTSIDAGEYYLVAEIDPSGALNETTTSNNVALSRALEVEAECFDPLEPNDSLATARSISERSYSNLSACAQSDDYYELCVNDDEKFSVTTTFNNQEGDLDMELLDQHFETIDSSARTGVDEEEVSVDYVNGDQCYYVHTFLQTSQQSLEINYEMNVDVETVDPSLQCDSHFEPNDAFGTASSFIAATKHDQALDRCPASDTDYYRLQLERGQQVTLAGTLDPTSQPGSLTLQLYEPNQQPTRNASTAPGLPTAEIEDYIAPSAGTYYLQVTASGSSRRISYTLEGEGLEGIDLAADNLWFWQGEYEANDTLLYEFDFANQRAETAISPTYSVYLGDSQTLDTSDDTELTSVTYNDLPGNTTETVTDEVQLPASIPSGETRYIHVQVSADGSQQDDIQTNNVATLAIDFE